MIGTDDKFWYMCMQVYRVYSNNQEIEYSKLSDPLTSFSDDSKVGADVVLCRLDDFQY